MEINKSILQKLTELMDDKPALKAGRNGRGQITARPALGTKAHMHPNNCLSGVYYVQTQEGADSITFMDPRSRAFVIARRASEGLITWAR
jgi:Putative 2OG-Fe(II) oxygenase